MIANVYQMEDCPRKRCRKWRLVADGGAGKRRTRVFHGTYTEAKAALMDFSAEVARSVPDSGETVCSYMAKWAAWREGEVRPGTSRSDGVVLRRLERMPIGSMPLGDVKPDDVREAVSQMRGSLSTGTVSLTLSKLSAVLNQARENGLIESNPCSSVKPPKAERVEKEALPPDALMALMDGLERMEPSGEVCAVYLMAACALRAGEALAASPTGVRGNVLHIESSIDASTGEVGSTKTDSGVRDVPMPSRLIAWLERWESARIATWRADSPTLACTETGGTMKYRHLRGWWETHRDGLGAGGLPMHRLRHSRLSEMARYMSAFGLQRYAGWSNIAPARVYVHDDFSELERAVSLAEGAFAHDLHTGGCN